MIDDSAQLAELRRVAGTAAVGPDEAAHAASLVHGHQDNWAEAAPLRPLALFRRTGRSSVASWRAVRRLSRRPSGPVRWACSLPRAPAAGRSLEHRGNPVRVGSGVGTRRAARRLAASWPRRAPGTFSAAASCSSSADEERGQPPPPSGDEPWYGSRHHSPSALPARAGINLRRFRRPTPTRHQGPNAEAARSYRAANSRASACAWTISSLVMARASASQPYLDDSREGPGRRGREAEVESVATQAAKPNMDGKPKDQRRKQSDLPRVSRRPLQHAGESDKNASTRSTAKLTNPAKTWASRKTPERPRGAITTHEPTGSTN